MTYSHRDLTRSHDHHYMQQWNAADNLWWYEFWRTRRIAAQPEPWRDAAPWQDPLMKDLPLV